MSQKFYDILPPKKALERPTLKKEILVEKKLRSSVSRKILLFLFFPLIILGLLSFLNLGRAEIEITLESELFDLEKKVLLDSNIQDLKTGLKEDALPATIIKEEKGALREFTATGQDSVEKKAEGMIRVYNEYSTSSQAFVANTRFVSAEGKLFRSLEKTTVPGQRYEGGRLAPGFVDIKVRAAQAGKDYNIKPTTFSIPGLLGTNMYTSFYAKSFTPMEGGLKGTAGQVTEENIRQAKEILKEELFEKGFLNLQKECEEQSLTLLESLISKEVLEESCSAQQGDNVDSFTCETRVMIKALVFNEEDLKNFIKGAILSKIPEGKEIQAGSLELSYFLESKNLEKGRADLNLASLAAVCSIMDENFLKRGIAGKSEEEIQIFLETYPGIKKAKLKIWPFWQKKIPRNLEKIEIKVLFE